MASPSFLPAIAARRITISPHCYNTRFSFFLDVHLLLRLRFTFWFLLVLRGCRSEQHSCASWTSLTPAWFGALPPPLIRLRLLWFRFVLFTRHWFHVFTLRTPDFLGSLALTLGFHLHNVFWFVVSRIRFLTISRCAFKAPPRCTACANILLPFRLRHDMRLPRSSFSPTMRTPHCCR